MSYWNQFLTPEHRAIGLSLEELADDFIQLKYQGKVLATFTQHTTIEALLHEADQQLNWIKSNIVFQSDVSVEEARKKSRCPYRQDLDLLCFESHCDKVYCPIFEKESGLLAQSLQEARE